MKLVSCVSITGRRKIRIFGECIEIILFIRATNHGVGKQQKLSSDKQHLREIKFKKTLTKLFFVHNVKLTQLNSTENYGRRRQTPLSPHHQSILS